MALDIATGNLVGGTATVTFTARYNVIELKNLDAANPMYVTTGTTIPTGEGGADEFEAGPGERISIPNNGPIWYQGQGTASPGTTVNLLGTGTAAYEVLGAG